MKNILVVGCAGQVGAELIEELRKRHGAGNVVGLDIRNDRDMGDGPFVCLDATDFAALKAVAEKYSIDTIYHLVSILSAAGEADPHRAWRISMESLKHVLDIAVEKKIERVFWPSSMAAFGPTTPKDNVPQRTILEPNTMYGVTKVSGELLCNYYHRKFGLDVRSVRYPGLISWKVMPDGGTTDYGTAMFYEALKSKKYICYLTEDSALPMMYMPDAIKATIDIMNADIEAIKVRTSYNLASMSFSPKELAREIRARIPEFVIEYEPEERRQNIANSWPNTIDDSAARADWGWMPAVGLKEMTDDMMKNLRVKLNIPE